MASQSKGSPGTRRSGTADRGTVPAARASEGAGADCGAGNDCGAGADWSWTSTQRQSSGFGGGNLGLAGAGPPNSMCRIRASKLGSAPPTAPPPWRTGASATIAAAVAFGVMELLEGRAPQLSGTDRPAQSRPHQNWVAAHQGIAKIGLPAPVRNPTILSPAPAPSSRRDYVVAAAFFEVFSWASPRRPPHRRSCRPSLSWRCAHSSRRPLSWYRRPRARPSACARRARRSRAERCRRGAPSQVSGCGCSPRAGREAGPEYIEELLHHRLVRDVGHGQPNIVESALLRQGDEALRVGAELLRLGDGRLDPLVGEERREEIALQRLLWADVRLSFRPRTW